MIFLAFQIPRAILVAVSKVLIRMVGIEVLKGRIIKEELLLRTQ